eukprot:1190701-Prorocentrum_minimum.AAC.2
MVQRSRQGLGEDVRTVVLGVDVEELDGPLSNPIANQLVANIDVLRLGIVHVVMGYEASTNVVNVRLDREVHGDDLVDLSVLEVRGYGRLLGDEEVEEGAVVEDTTAGEGLLVSVVASPIRVRLDARVAVRGGLVMDAQDEVVVDGGLEVSNEQSRAAVPTVDDRAAWGPSRRSWSGSGPSPSEWPLSWCSCPRCAPR